VTLFSIIAVTLARAAAEPLAVLVDAGASGLPPERIRQAIARELRTDVTAKADGERAELRVVIGDRRHAVMTYRGSGRGAPALERALDLPADADSAVEMLALMAGNLARNEAAELLQQLRPPASKEDASAAVATADAPSPTVAPPLPAPAAPESPAGPTPSSSDGLRDAFLGLTLAHPIGLIPDSDQYRFALELGFAYSRVGAIGGFGFNPFAIRIDRSLEGASASLVWHSVGGNTNGVSLSGIASWGEGSLSGVEMALALVWRGGNAEGFSGSGVFLGSNGDLSGFGGAIGATYRAGSTEGVQLSGAANLLGGDLAGFEGAIGLNLARDVDGVQLGLVNIGRRVRGTQIGLVNIADEVEGVPLGLVNVVKKGRTQAVTWASGGPVANAAVKYLNGPVYTMVTFGWHPENGGDSRYETGFGLGLHIPIAPAFLEADTLYAADRRFNESDGDRTDILRYRATAGVEVTSLLSVFGGLSLRHEIPGGPANSFVRLDYVAGIQVF